MRNATPELCPGGIPCSGFNRHQHLDRRFREFRAAFAAPARALETAPTPASAARVRPRASTSTTRSTRTRCSPKAPRLPPGCSRRTSSTHASPRSACRPTSEMPVPQSGPAVHRSPATFVGRVLSDPPVIGAGRPRTPLVEERFARVVDSMRDGWRKPRRCSACRARVSMRGIGGGQ